MWRNNKKKAPPCSLEPETIHNDISRCHLWIHKIKHELRMEERERSSQPANQPTIERVSDERQESVFIYAKLTSIIRMFVLHHMP